MKKMVYLDNAATTFPKPEIVYDTMDSFLRNECVNAGRGSYSLARQGNELINDTKRMILKLINCNKGEVIFEPSATIAINQILRGINWREIKNIYVSPFEHNAIIRTIHSLQKVYGFKIHIIPFNPLTFELESEEFRIMMAKNNPNIILISHVSNVTGYILPIVEISELSNKYDPIIVVDASQSMGLVNIDTNKEFKYVDFIVFAGHKTLFGPYGIAGFVKLNDLIDLTPIITGGTGSDSLNLDMPLDSKYEAGSYNLYAIAGLNSALKWINDTTVEEIFRKEQEVTKMLVEDIKDIYGIEVYSPNNSDNHVGIVSFNIEGYNSADIGAILDDEYGICVRTGHHCAPLIGEFLGGLATEGTVRCSISYFTSKEDIEYFLNALKSI